MAGNRGGIPKAKVDNPELQRMLDTMAKAIEVLLGVDETNPDRAVTYRALKDNGFQIDLLPQTKRGVPGKQYADISNKQILIPTTDGPTTAPTSLAADTATGARIGRLTWNAPSKNVRTHEIWRATSNDRAHASFEKHATLMPEADVYEFVQDADVGSTYYYWIRALGTNGKYSSWEPSGATSGIEVTV